MTASRRRLGRKGEDIARRRLESDGYSVLHSNYRVGRLEIDLVAEKDGVLVFVEVRTRKGRSFGPPEESITPAKQSHLVNAAQAYLQAHGATTRDWRIDVVVLNLGSNGRVLRLDVIENAVEA
jgi:putative endonuclease